MAVVEKKLGPLCRISVVSESLNLILNLNLNLNL